MADEPARTVPRVTDAVHYVRRRPEKEPCRAGWVLAVPRDEDGDVYPNGRIIVMTCASGEHTMLSAGVNVQVQTMMVEHSVEGIGGTYHFPHECPEDR